MKGLVIVPDSASKEPEDGGGGGGTMILETVIKTGLETVGVLPATSLAVAVRV